MGRGGGYGGGKGVTGNSCGDGKFLENCKWNIWSCSLGTKMVLQCNSLLENVILFSCVVYLQTYSRQVYDDF